MEAIKTLIDVLSIVFLLAASVALLLAAPDYSIAFGVMSLICIAITFEPEGSQKEQGV